MKKQIVLFAWWLDSAAQLTMLLGITFSSALGWWLVVLYLLFFLGCWQLGSGVVWGITQRDNWRLLYLGAALAFVTLAGFSLPFLDKMLPASVFSGMLVLMGVISYLAAWVFLAHTHQQKPVFTSQKVSDFVPSRLG